MWKPAGAAGAGGAGADKPDHIRLESHQGRSPPGQPNRFHHIPEY